MLQNQNQADVGNQEFKDPSILYFSTLCTHNLRPYPLERMKTW